MKNFDPIEQSIPLILTFQTNTCLKYIAILEEGKATHIEKRQDWEDYIYSLKVLPETIADGYSFTPGTKNEKAHYKRLTKTYLGLSEWLDYLNPGTKPPNPELFFTDKIALKPRAELSKATLDLATELLPRCPEFQEQFNSPADIWFAWELQVLELHFWNSGFVSGKPDIRPSKSSMAKANREQANFLDVQKEERLSWSKTSQKELRLNTALFVLSERISREDETFKNSDVLNTYVKKRRAWAKAVRSPDWEIPAFEDGVLLPGGRNAKRIIKNCKKKQNSRPRVDLL